MGEGTLRLVLDTQRARRETPAGLARRQRDRLAELVAFARRTSPAYRTCYRGLPDLVEDPIMLPVVDKATPMGEFDDWVTDPTVTASGVQAFADDPTRIGQPFLGRYTVTTTSGTTGTSGLFLLDRASLTVAGAVMLRALTSWLTAGDVVRIVRARGRIAMVMATGGHFASAVAAARLRATPAGRRLIQVLSVHQPMSELVDSLNRFQPAILAPYASIAALLTGEQHAGRLRIRPALVVLAAEGLSPSQYSRIVTAFPTATVVSSYAATECPFLSVSCPDGWLHVNSDWAILEPVTADHRPVPAGPLSDTVLLTNLANRIQPILRYDLGDRVLQRPDPCPCRSPFPAVRVHGRVADLLTIPRLDGDPAARSCVGVDRHRHLRPLGDRRRAPRPGPGRRLGTDGTVIANDQLSGYRPGETLQDRTARAALLLTDRVRPEWHIERAIIADPRDMIGVCAVPGCPREVVRHGLCNGHALRWQWQHQPPWEHFVASTGAHITESLAVPKCTVPWCRRGRDRQPEYLCQQHFDSWNEAGQPPLKPRRASVPVDDPGLRAPVCRLSPCPVLAEPDAAYCQVHLWRWRRGGSPDHAVFEAVVTNKTTRAGTSADFLAR